MPEVDQLASGSAPAQETAWRQAGEDMVKRWSTDHTNSHRVTQVLVTYGCLCEVADQEPL